MMSERDTAAGQPRTVPRFADFVAGPWTAACYRRCKPSTRRRVDSALHQQLLPAFGWQPLDQIDLGAVQQWFDEYSRTAPGGANRTLDVLRQILNHAIACGHLEINPTRGVTHNPRPTLNRFLSRVEVRRLYAVLDERASRSPHRQQQADLIRLLLLTGCRIGELVHLQWNDMDEDRLRLTDSKTGPRTIFLNAQARAILGRQPRKGPLIFPSRASSSQPRSTDLPLWRSTRRQAGITDVRLHDLRHTFASHAVLRGVPLPVVSRLLGHAQTRMTLRYVHLNDRDIAAASERIATGIDKILTGEVLVCSDASVAGDTAGVCTEGSTVQAAGQVVALPNGT